MTTQTQSTQGSKTFLAAPPRRLRSDDRCIGDSAFYGRPVERASPMARSSKMDPVSQNSSRV